MKIIREMGELPLSIGTSLAIEAIMGEPHLETHMKLWVNLRTLIRNLIASVPSSERYDLNPEDVAEDVLEEFGTIRENVMHLTGEWDNCVIYHTTHESLTRKMPRAILKSPKTNKQCMVDGILRGALEILAEKLKAELKIYDVKIHGKGDDALMITHLPIDLLSRYEFKELKLLESHTGKVKKFNEWFSKLQNYKTLPKLPFNHYTLQVFGDGELFSPLPIKLKREVISVAQGANWNEVTTEAKIKASLEKHKDPQFVIYMLDILRDKIT